MIQLLTDEGSKIGTKGGLDLPGCGFQQDDHFKYLTSSTNTEMLPARSWYALFASKTHASDCVPTRMQAHRLQPRADNGSHFCDP